MKCYKSIEEINIEGSSVVTLGKFDGVHKGHRKLIARVFDCAREQNLSSAMFTFDVAPQTRLGQRKNENLMTLEEKAAQLEELGFDIMVECPFTEEIRSMEAEVFVKKILLETLHAVKLIVGTDFRFGKNRTGSAKYLKEAGTKLGFSTEIIEKEQDEGIEISSTYIKEVLKTGNMEKVSRLLGYHYYIWGPVVHGRTLGRTIGFPTVNQLPEVGKLLPPFGVYFSKVSGGFGTAFGVTNIGIKPTVGGKVAGVETHLINSDDNLYDENITVELLKFYRPEQKFPSTKELKIAIANDRQAAQRYFGIS